MEQEDLEVRQEAGDRQQDVCKCRRRDPCPHSCSLSRDTSTVARDAPR